jgi:O-acetyl-ADP-ribose deacetylase (regulator of RNase III)
MDSVLPTGQAVVTGGGDLRARCVIHTVGPVWHGGSGGEPGLLADAYRNSLRLAVENGLKTMAFPSISTGAYGYPTEQAAGVALEAVVDFLKGNDFLSEVAFVLFDGRTISVYIKALEKLLEA